MIALLVVGLMVAGLILLAIEIFVIPGFGVIGALGIAAAIGSAYLAYAELSATYAAIAVAGGVVGGLAMLWLAPRTRLGKSMVLETRNTGNAAKPGLTQLLEREGVALTTLRPAGSIEIDERPVDVVTDGEFIERGSRVRVIRVEGSRVVVEKVG